MLQPSKQIRLLVLVSAFLLFFFRTSQSQDAVFCPLYNFGPQPGDPLWPQPPSRLAAPGDGWLYGTSNGGGNGWGQGTIFKITPAGELTLIWKFDGHDTGAGPQGGLTDGKDGYLYGTTWGGGNYGAGTIFRIPYGANANTKPEVLYQFRNSSVQNLVPEQCDEQKRCTWSPRQRADVSGGFPTSAPVKGPDGNLHGVTSYSNNQQFGTLYSMPPTGGEKNFHVTCIFQPALLKDKDMKEFVCSPDSKLANPAVLILGNDNHLYGTTFAGFGGVFRVDGTKVTALHEFSTSDGSKPFDLTQGSDGMLYGTTISGGSVNWGVIYRLDPQTNSFNVLYQFVPRSPPGQDGNPAWSGGPGAGPAGLAEGRAGWLYGVARGGGRPNRGVIFRIPMAGTNGRGGTGYEVLHEFNFRDGRVPSSTPLFVGPDMFGMTYQGGWNAKTNNISDGGVFYRMSVDQPAITGDVPIGMMQRCAHQPSPPSDGPCLLVDAPTVRVSAHVTVKQITESPDPLAGWRQTTPFPELDDAIAVHMNCTDRPHIVQFIYREKIGPNGPYHGSLSSTAGDYLLTIDPNRACWNPDSLSRTSFYVRKRDPYYEAGRQAHWDCNGLTIFDDPSFTETNNPGAPSTVFVDNRSEIWRAHARDYLICGGRVQKQVDWVVEQKYGGPRTYSAGAPQDASEIPDEFLGLLASKDFLLPFPLKNPMLPTQTGPACAQ
jgi:uncharacterized repeat protein (TIGR03803 family)